MIGSPHAFGVEDRELALLRFAEDLVCLPADHESAKDRPTPTLPKGSGYSYRSYLGLKRGCYAMTLGPMYDP